MDLLAAVLVGGLYAGAFYLLLDRSVVRLVIGLVLLGQATNLLVFTAAGVTRARPPLVAEGALQPTPPVTDPLPQALILTAVVISFGMLAFALVLVHRTHRRVGLEDVDALGETDA